MLDLRETLQALARLEPVRFAEYKPGVFWVNVPDNSLELRDLEGFYGQALLAAALMDLCNSRGWDWERTATKYEGNNPHEPGGDLPQVVIYGRQRGELLSRGRLVTVKSAEPFALTLAHAVVQAFEATP